jgi:hypothetical protein
MLTEDLTATLRDHAEDITGTPASLLTAVERRMQQHHHRRVASVTAATVFVVAAVSVAAVVLADSHSSRGSTRVSIAGSTQVPCDQPSRAVPHYIAWPCASGAVSAYDEQEFDAIAPLALRNVSAKGLQIRVLAFGPLPNSRPGSTVVYAEVWPRYGDEPASGFASYSVPARLQPGYHGKTAPDAPLLESAVGGSLPAGRQALFVDAPVGYSNAATPHSCEQMDNNPPTNDQHDYLAPCADTVVARQGVTAIRVVDSKGKIGPAIPVHNGLAGLTDTAEGRRGWTIQGLNDRGTVIASTPYEVTF